MNTKEERDTNTAQIFLEAIRHHRNQMNFLSHLMREHSLNRATGIKLMKSHAAEIKSLLDIWFLEHPIQRKQKP